MFVVAWRMHGKCCLWLHGWRCRHSPSGGEGGGVEDIGWRSAGQRLGAATALQHGQWRSTCARALAPLHNITMVFLTPLQRA